jgi:hypothetical protein
MTWAVPTQPPARPQTVTPGSTRGPTPTTVIARREFNCTPPLETGRSLTHDTAAHAHIPRTGRSEGPLCPPVPSLGEAWLLVAPCFSMGIRHAPGFQPAESPHILGIGAPQVATWKNARTPPGRSLTQTLTRPWSRTSPPSRRAGDPSLLRTPSLTRGRRSQPAAILWRLRQSSAPRNERLALFSGFHPFS